MVHQTYKPAMTVIAKAVIPVIIIMVGTVASGLAAEMTVVHPVDTGEILCNPGMDGCFTTMTMPLTVMGLI